MTEGDTKYHVGEHDVLLADVGLVETDGAERIGHRHVEDAILAEDVGSPLRYHFERIFPRFFLEVLGYGVGIIQEELAVNIGFGKSHGEWPKGFLDVDLGYGASEDLGTIISNN